MDGLGWDGDGLIIFGADCIFGSGPGPFGVSPLSSQHATIQVAILNRTSHLSCSNLSALASSGGEKEQPVWIR